MVLLVRMDQGTQSIYRPRRPERTDLHLAVRENLDLFLETYDERFLDQYGPLTARACRTLEGYIRCGIISAGFARVRCGACGHKLLTGLCRSVVERRRVGRLVVREWGDILGHHGENVGPDAIYLNCCFLDQTKGRSGCFPSVLSWILDSGSLSSWLVIPARNRRAQ